MRTGAQLFTSGGEAYDAFMGRYAVELAPLFADLAGVSPGQHAVDVGCGTGMLTAELVRRLGPGRVTGCDPAPAQLAGARGRVPQVELRQAAAEDLPWPDGEEAVDAVGIQTSPQLRAMRFGEAGDLSTLLTGAGLTKVSETSLVVESHYGGADELWAPFSFGIGPAGAYLTELPRQQQEALRTAYLDRLGRPAGAFTLSATALVATGTVPRDDAAVTV